MIYDDPCIVNLLFLAWTTRMLSMHTRANAVVVQCQCATLTASTHGMPLF